MINHEIARDIFLQIHGEAGARHDYEDFLAQHAEKMNPEDVKEIQEIQQDEANHMVKLMAMAFRYDGNLSASTDGLKEAFEIISKHL